MIKFCKDASPYCAGDVAGPSAQKAAKYVDRGQAVYVVEGGEPKVKAEVAPPVNRAVEKAETKAEPAEKPKKRRRGIFGKRAD